MNSVVAALLLLAAASAQSGSLTFTKPAGWTDRPLASTMRVAEFVVARAGNEPEDAEVIVYYFGGGGGSVEANIERWTKQFQSTGTPVRSSSTINGLKITTVDVAGTYIAEVKPGSTERHNKPGFAMRAAVIETPKGPYFVKLTGPAAAVGRASAAFDQFLQSVRFPTDH